MQGRKCRKVRKYLYIFFPANFITDIAVIACIKLLLKLTFYAHIEGQMIKNFIESILLNLKDLQGFRAKYRFHYNPSLS